MIPSCAINAVARGEISPSCLATLVALTAFNRDTRESRDARGGDREVVGVFRRDLADVTGLTPRTITSHIGQLRDAGLLVVTQDAWGGASMYTLRDPCGQCFAEQPASRPLAVDDPTPGNEMQGIPGSRYLDHHQEEEAEIDRRIRARCEARRPDDLLAYFARARADATTREEVRAEIREERKRKAFALAVADCARCDGRGYFARRRDGTLTTTDDPEAVVNIRCDHFTENEACEIWDRTPTPDISDSVTS